MINGKDGVDYITKNNKKKQEITKYASGEAVELAGTSSPKDNFCLGEDPTGKEALVSMAASEPTPLGMKDVKRCLVQLWDNGETSRQRYKLKIRLNLADGTDADFIAALTKDPRNFIKHTADKELARNWRKLSNDKVKAEYGVKPWLGKFHMVQGGGYKEGFHQQTVEPNCFATVWWDEEAKDWSATIMMYDFALEEIDMQSRNVTDKQRAQGCRSSRLWINPIFQDEKPRPLTWAESRKQK